MATFVAADWSIDRATKNIRYIGDLHGGTAPSYVTGINLHRALQDFADDETDTGDDELSIIDQTPSDRGGVDTNITLLNGYNIDDASSEYIYDTSITQSGGDEIYDGIQVFGNANTIQVIQNGARLTNDFWNEAKMIAATSDAASSTSHRFMVKVRDNGADIDGRRLLGTQRELGTQYTEFFIGGGTNRGNNVLALTANDDINNNTIEATIATWTDIVNDNEGYVGIDADGNAANEFYYSDWELAARSKNDFYERAKWIQREGSAETIYGLNGDIFRGITHEIDVDTPTGTLVEPELLTWSGGTASITAFADTGDSTHVTVTSNAHGLSESDVVVITGTTNYNGTFAISSVTANTFDIVDTWVADDATGTWNHQLGTGQLLATNSTTAATKIWIQLLSGVAPTDGQTITGNGGGTVDVNVTVSAKVLPATFVGISTGSALIGAFGLGVGADDLTNNDKVTDLTGTTNTPPNNVTFNQNNLVVGDRVLVAPEDGAGGLDYDQLSLNTTLSGATETAVVTTAAIPTDTPTSGTIRVELDSGTYRRITYTSYTGSTFTIPSTDFSTDNATSTNNVFVSYIDKVAGATTESFTSVFLSPRTLFIRVRNATIPIKTFESTGTLGSGGGSSTTGRIADD